ncbi:7-cyano-7-deazaguanine synthase QueC [Alicyclobacillus sp. TC]|uniref:7-cyano-7-deazaguanine synthase QueC n=1 Tax=Alicyclobacillus sp. TC TaxID=2606450 RepID=UPI0019343444|nr:7-cyano-7-deazaguanine synthase QueC [Alicyclobacillus sp. TC]QRF24263.1 7-cyano-7-deazaguanine synthase QueC [Alicyclobacillus sp. TC]
MLNRKAVVVLSGGLDSTTCLGIAADEGYSLYTLTFDYGQRHARELRAAEQVADYYQVADRRIVKLDFLRKIGKSALTDFHLSVPKNVHDGEDIPITYVPGRNLLFLSLAASFAEAIEAQAIYIGVNALDYSGYPDCRPQFIQAVQKVLDVGTKTAVEGAPISLQTPLLHLTKAEIIRWGHRLGVPYQLTTSCYEGAEEACGECDSCRLRLRGFKEAGLIDPIPYRSL